MRTSLFLIVGVWLATMVSAQAGSLFPPEGTSGECPSGKVLFWTGSSVTCKDPSPGVTIAACPAGQVMVEIKNGAAKCVNPNDYINTVCPSGQMMVQLEKGKAKCLSPSPYVTVASCPSGQVMRAITNGTPVCVDKDDPITVSCPSNMVLTGISNGVAQCTSTQGGGNTININCPTGKVMTGISNGTAQCTTVGTGSSTLTATCPYGKALQSIIGGSPTCTDIAESSSISVSCGTGEFLKGITSSGTAQCAVPANNTKRFETTIDTITTGCTDSANPAVEQSNPFLPGLDAYTFASRYVRWMNSCGTRYCNAKGYVTGKVSEYYQGSAWVDCW
jgi:hypothetical protein